MLGPRENRRGPRAGEKGSGNRAGQDLSKPHKRKYQPSCPSGSRNELKIPKGRAGQGHMGEHSCYARPLEVRVEMVRTGRYIYTKEAGTTRGELTQKAESDHVAD